jgi:hypothetical protein
MGSVVFILSLQSPVKWIVSPLLAYACGSCREGASAGYTEVMQGPSR